MYTVGSGQKMFIVTTWGSIFVNYCACAINGLGTGAGTAGTARELRGNCGNWRGNRAWFIWELATELALAIPQRKLTYILKAARVPTGPAGCWICRTRQPGAPPRARAHCLGERRGVRFITQGLYQVSNKPRGPFIPGILAGM